MGIVESVSLQRNCMAKLIFVLKKMNIEDFVEKGRQENFVECEKKRCTIKERGFFEIFRENYCIMQVYGSRQKLSNQDASYVPQVQNTA